MMSEMEWNTDMPLIFFKPVDDYYHPMLGRISWVISKIIVLK